MKRKASVDVSNEEEINTLKPTAYFKPKGGRAYTLSIALPGSIIAKYGNACLTFASGS